MQKEPLGIGSIAVMILTLIIANSPFLASALSKGAKSKLNKLFVVSPVERF